MSGTEVINATTENANVSEDDNDMQIDEGNEVATEVEEKVVVKVRKPRTKPVVAKEEKAVKVKAVKPTKEGKAVKEGKTVKAATKPVKAGKEVKEVKTKKEPKATKEPKETKAKKEPKETKTKEPKEPKEVKVKKTKTKKVAEPVEEEPVEAEEGEEGDASGNTPATIKLLDMKPKAFMVYLENSPKKYNTLNRYRKILSSDLSTRNRTKLRHVEKQMQGMLEEGVKTRRRVSGTGKRVEVAMTYLDTASNRKLERVGQAYTKVIYEDAEFEDNHRAKMRRRRRQPRVVDESAPKRKNLWIDSIAEAKIQLNTAAFVIVRSTITNPEDPEQIVGNQLYILAKQIMAVKKAEAAAEAEAAEPVVEAPAVVVEEPVAVEATA